MSRERHRAAAVLLAPEVRKQRVSVANRLTPGSIIKVSDDFNFKEAGNLEVTSIVSTPRKYPDGEVEDDYYIEVKRASGGRLDKNFFFAHATTFNVVESDTSNAIAPALVSPVPLSKVLV